MPVNNLKYLLYFSLLLCTNFVFGQADVSVRVEVENSTPAENELVYAKVFVTNEGDKFRNDLQVSLRLSPSLFFVEVVSPNITFDDADLLWSVDQLVLGETDSMRFAIQPNYGGVHTISAELVEADFVDWDSSPGNDKPYEDDQDQVCLSVPVKVECGQEIVLHAPKDQSSYSWYLNEELLSYAVHDTIHPNRSGEYRFEVGGNSCATGNCCPVIIDRSMCLHDMALVATASEISQTSDYQTITITLYNQGAGAVSKVSMYVTTSKFMRLRPDTKGWQLSGTLMTSDWTGLLHPGESTEVEFDIQAISGGEPEDYQMFSEISGFYAGTTSLIDVDSRPDLDPTNDKVINDEYLLAESEDEDDSDIVSLTDCPLTVVLGNNEVCAGESITLTANANESSATYEWSGSDQLSCTNCASPTLVVTSDVDLTLVTKTEEGCVQTQLVEVRTSSCIEGILLIAGLNNPDTECLEVEQGTQPRFCNQNQVPAGIVLSDTYRNGEACVTARTDGTWAGGFDACLELCKDNNCQPVELKVIGLPKRDEITAASGELVCIADLLQMNTAAIDVDVQGGTSDLYLVQTENNCFELVEPSTSYQETEFQVIHTYSVFGETIYDTTVVTVPGRSVCNFEIFSEAEYLIEADPTTQETGPDMQLCLDGALIDLLSATYTVDGQAVGAPSTGCEAYQIAKYSLRELPSRWNDNGWQILSYKKANRQSITDFYAPTMDDVVAKLKSVDPSSNVSFTSSQLLLEIKGYTEAPGELVLVHLESAKRLSMQPLIVTGYGSWALEIPEGLPVGEYEIAATNPEGCLDIATLIVQEGSEETVVRDTAYASIELDEPFVICGLEGYSSPSSDWLKLGEECYSFTPDRLGFAGYHAFAKTENQITKELIYAITVVDRACAPMMVSENVEVTSSRCRSEYISLGLTRPDYSVSSSSGRVLSVSQVTGTRPGATYDFSSLPEQGLIEEYTIVRWDGLPNLQASSGNLQAIFRQLRESGQDVDIFWNTDKITAAGQNLGDLTIKNSSGQEILLRPESDVLSTYGRFYGRTGKNTVNISHAGCRDQMIAEVKCQVIVWGGGSIFVNGGLGFGSTVGLSEFDLPENVATWEILESPEMITATKLPDSSGIAFTVTDDKFEKDALKLLVRDTAGIQYEVLVELNALQEDCLGEIWQEEGYTLVADPRTGTAPFFFPESFDENESQVFVNGERQHSGFVKRDQIVSQTYAIDGTYSKISTPSGKTIEVTGTLGEAISEVLAKAEATLSDGQLNLVNIEGESTLYGLDQNGIWQPMEPLKQSIESRYALLFDPGVFEIELKTLEGNKECSDKLSLNVKPCTMEHLEEAITVKVGETREWCLPASTTGDVVLSIENVCKGRAGEFTSVNWDANTGCYTLDAYESGTEYLCLKRRYMSGSVDSIDVTLTIEEGSKLSLVADQQKIEFGQFEIVDVLSNDAIPNQPVQVSLISEPFFGRAQVVGNSAIEYLHYGSDCEKDVFTYEVCQGDVCDSTTVELQVVCSELLVYNGVSPNGDGLNDEFTIIGLSQYPDHVITIFNRQGNVLTSMSDYQNDWAGEVNGKVLPTGTYFYVIDLGDGDSKSGYIQLSK